MDYFVKYSEIFKKFGIEDSDDIQKRWQESHRFYHNENHLNQLLEDIEVVSKKELLSEPEKEVLVLTAFFHDVIYDPTRQDNEEVSAEYFLKKSKKNTQTELIHQIILDTKQHESEEKLSKIFCNLDTKVVHQSTFSQLLVWERQIFKEFQFLDWRVYRAGRLHFLEKMKLKYSQNAAHLGHLIDYVEHYRPKIGVYPGSFNPFHLGHLDILEKAEQIFDKVTIARGINPDKMDVNADKLQVNVLKYRHTENFTGFLTKYVSTKEDFADVTIIRGLRNGDDLDYEVNQFRFMQEMKPDVKIIFIPSDKKYEHISSSSIRNLDKIDPDFSKRYMPE